MRPLRVLFLSDTHLGLDLPARPRVVRRRRGPELFEACRRALAPAREGDVDLVVHGGDLLFRSKVPAWLVHEAVEPLREVADAGTPVVIVPGNHERSKIPFPLLVEHPSIHVLHEPRTVRLRAAGLDVAVFGFPFSRRVDGPAFRELLRATRWRERPANVRLLLLHQTIEGARVGVQDFTFRRGRDVVATRDLPGDVAAVLCGHIHRAQVLRADAAGRPLPAPVIHAGSTARTSFAERLETKGYFRLELVATATGSGRLWRSRFIPLPSRPMVHVEISIDGLSRRALAEALATRLAALDPEAIVKVLPEGTPRPEARDVLSAASLRRLAPATMNVDLDRRAARRLFGA